MTDTTNSEFVLSTCPRDCYDACGLRIRVDSGVVTQIAGDPNHEVAKGKLCKKCSIGYNSNWLDADARLTHPLRRVGKKGDADFETVSWDTAIDEICSKLKEIVNEFGAQSIYNTHYTGTFAAIGYHFPMRFFNRLGATEVNPDSVCNLAGHLALEYVYGSSVDGFDPRTVKDSNCVMVWGANPANAGPHVFEHWLKPAKATVIVIDPLRTETAAAADIHLQPFPGCDAALAFSMMNVLVTKGLVDDAFINQFCLGWKELLPSVLDCNPEWAEKVTGVATENIIRAAEIYGAGPSLLWLGQGFQRQPKGGNAMRSCSILPAITGNIGKVGAGFLYLNGSGHRNIDADDYLLGTALSEGEPSTISHMDFAEHIENSSLSKALFCWNVNNLASSPEQSRLRKAMQREDLLTVAIDIFPTDTTDYADYILPAASFVECNDLVVPYFDLTVSAQSKAVEPMGNALSNSDIFRKLANGMNYENPSLYESDLDILDSLIKQTGLEENFDSLKIKGTVPISSEPIIQFENLSFKTPSKMIEIKSATAEMDDLPLLPIPHADIRPTNNMLRLLTPAPSWAMNTTFGNSEKIDRQQGEATVIVHPDDAESLELNDGDRVRVFNSVGSLELTLRVSLETQKGVALSYKGRWLKREKNISNVNVLNSGEKADMGESSAVHGIEVSIEKITYSNTTT